MSPAVVSRPELAAARLLLQQMGICPARPAGCPACPSAGPDVRRVRAGGGRRGVARDPAGVRVVLEPGGAGLGPSGYPRAPARRRSSSRVPRSRPTWWRAATPAAADPPPSTWWPRRAASTGARWPTGTWTQPTTRRPRCPSPLCVLLFPADGLDLARLACDPCCLAAADYPQDGDDRDGDQQDSDEDRRDRAAEEAEDVAVEQAHRPAK